MKLYARSKIQSVIEVGYLMMRVRLFMKLMFEVNFISNYHALAQSPRAVTYHRPELLHDMKRSTGLQESKKPEAVVVRHFISHPVVRQYAQNVNKKVPTKPIS